MTIVEKQKPKKEADVVEETTESPQNLGS